MWRRRPVLEHLDPLSAVGLRAAIGLVFLLPMIRRQRLDAAWWTSALRVSLPFALGMVVQQYAFVTATVTNVSFLINASTVMTPVLAWMLMGDRPTRLVVAAAVLTLVGAFMLSGGLQGAVGIGDLAAVAAAGCFALWLVELSRHMRKHGQAAATAGAQFAVTAILTLPFGAASGQLTLDAVFAAGPELLMLGIFSTAVAFALQAAAQRHVTGTTAAILISAESLFGAAGAYLLLSEQVSALQAVGCLLVLLGIVIAAVPASGPLVTWANRRGPKSLAPALPSETA